MLNLTYRNRPNPATLTPENLTTIEDIKNAIIEQVGNNNISQIQLNKILNLIKSTVKLKAVLPLL